MSFDSSMRIQGNFFQPVNPVSPAGGQRTQGTDAKQSFGGGGNPLINSNDFQDFQRNYLANCNTDKPAAMNNDPAAGVLRSFDLTA